MAARCRLIVGWSLALLGGSLMLGGLWCGTVRAESGNAVVISVNTPIGPGSAGYVVRSPRHGVASTPMRSPRPR
jgi:hypothetical protein